MPTYQSGPNGFPKGCAFTLVTSNATNLSVPTDFTGAESHASASALFAASVLSKTCEGCNIFGLTLSAATTSSRTLTLTTVDGGLDDYTQNQLVITIKSGASAGDYIPFGGVRGVFMPGRTAAGVLLGGGFAFKTSNSELAGVLWWEPQGSY